MKTTLIIPTMNGRDDVEKVLYGINRLYKHREKLMGGCDIDKVSFVLNGPDDGTGEILKFYENRPEYYNPERLDSRKGKGDAHLLPRFWSRTRCRVGASTFVS